MENEHSTESSNHFCFSRDEIGHLNHKSVTERLVAMTRNERELYRVPSHDLIVDPDWRAHLAKWSYNVADYFDLSREVVALSMSLFDRFFATRMCAPSSDLCLLTSIATLHIAIKIRESAIIKLSTLSWIGRGKFSEKRIATQELLVLMNSRWLVNPPTAIAFIMHLLLLLPNNLNLDFKREILDSSRFMAGR